MRLHVLALVVAGLIDRPPASTDEAAQLTNVTLQLTRKRHGSEVTIANPNDFSVFGVVASCDFKDRRGQAISSLIITITDAIRANGSRTVRNMDVECPAEVRSADCTSLQAKRFPE
jgi:hypothetical protein